MLLPQASPTGDLQQPIYGAFLSSHDTGTAVLGAVGHAKLEGSLPQAFPCGWGEKVSWAKAAALMSPMDEQRVQEEL